MQGTQEEQEQELPCRIPLQLPYLLQLVQQDLQVCNNNNQLSNKQEVDQLLLLQWDLAVVLSPRPEVGPVAVLPGNHQQQLSTTTVVLVLV